MAEDKIFYFTDLLFSDRIMSFTFETAMIIGVYRILGMFIKLLILG